MNIGQIIFKIFKMLLPESPTPPPPPTEEVQQQMQIEALSPEEQRKREMNEFR